MLSRFDDCSIYCLLLTFWVAPVSWMPVCMGWTVLLVERSTSISMSQDQEQVSHPYAIQYPEKFVSYWDKCCASKVPQDSPEVDFESSKVASKVWVLKQTQSTVLSIVTHMTTLSIISCVMNVRNQTSQAFVACCCPFCDCSSKFVYGPWNVKSSNSCQVQACQDNSRANFRLFTN